MTECFVGFDTSNYTTSVAVCEKSGKIIANLKSPLSVSDGERGLRQSDAVFAHVKNLPELCDELSEILSELKPVAVGCSSKPRDIEGSYMPCFLSGIAAAHSFAAGYGLQIYNFSHQAGHVKAALYSSGAKIDGDFVAFHVSGGTTEILYVKQENNGELSIKKIGGTKDLNAGQSIDRVGVAMGLRFPCGREMDELALSNTTATKDVRISVDGLECNLSGLENLSLKLYENKNDRALTSAFAFEFLYKTFAKLTENIREIYYEIPIVYAGGVMSSRYISSRLKRDNAYFALPEFSSDNAAGIALLARDKYLRENK